MMELNYLHMSPYRICVERQVGQSPNRSILADEGRTLGIDGSIRIENGKKVLGLRSSYGAGYLELPMDLIYVPKENGLVFGKVYFRECARELIRR